MWTYFTILLSLAVLIAVFVYRLVLLLKGKTAYVAVEKVDDLPVDEEEKKVKLSKENKEKVQALCNRGEAPLESGKDEEAIKCFVQALTIDTSHLQTQQKLALLYLQKQMYGAAAALFQQLAVQTNDPIHYSHLGLTLFQQSDYENAKIAYQTAVDLDSSRPQRFVSLSQVYKAMGQLTNAIIAINKAIEIDQQNIDFLCLLADLQMSGGNHVAARESLNKVLEMDGDNKEAKDMLKEIRRVRKRS